MRVKIITSKPNKSGETCVYLDKGADRHMLIDLEGQEVDIVPVTEDAPIKSLYEAYRDKFMMLFDTVIHDLEASIHAEGYAAGKESQQPEHPEGFEDDKN